MSKSLREQFGESLVELGDEVKNLVVLDADLSSSTKTKYFAKKYPERFFNIGIAEQNMLGIAMGLATSGKIAVVSGFTCFTIGRGWEIIKNIAYDKLNVKICTTHAGLSASKDGGSHQSLEDIALMSAIPNIKIYCPCDPIEIKKNFKRIILQDGPIYLRLMREKLDYVFDEDYGFSEDLIEKLNDFSQKSGGQKFKFKYFILIFSTGSMTTFYKKLDKLFKEHAINSMFVHVGQIKPLNTDKIKELVRDARAEAEKLGGALNLIATLEEHNQLIGFGALIMNALTPFEHPPILKIGVEDRFGQTGTLNQLYDEYGLSPNRIVKRVLSNLKNN